MDRRAGARAGRLCVGAGGAHRADRRDDGRRARRDGAGAFGHPAASMAEKIGRAGSARSGGSNGRTGRWRWRSPRRIRRACAGRNSAPPGATSWPSGSYAEATFDMLQFGLRLGSRPRQMVTTTPRPIPLVRRLLDDPETVVTRARTIGQCGDARGGVPYASGGALRAARGSGGRSSTAELIEDRADALWQRAHAGGVPRGGGAGAEAHRGGGRPAGRVGRATRTPAASWRRGSTPTAAATCWRTPASQGLTPARWARRVVDLYHRLEADRIVAEVNQGGDMVEAVIRQAGRERADREGAGDRGENCSAPSRSRRSTSRGRCSHVGAFPELEDEMCDFALGGLSSRALAGPARRAGLGAVGADADRRRGSRG